MAGYSCFARRLVTAQGYRLGVGGLCPAGRAADCAAALAPLAALELSGREDIYQVDYLLARAIQTLAPAGMSRNKQLAAKLVRGGHFWLLTQLYRIKNRI